MAPNHFSIIVWKSCSCVTFLVTCRRIGGPVLSVCIVVDVQQVIPLCTVPVEWFVDALLYVWCPLTCGCLSLRVGHVVTQVLTISSLTAMATLFISMDTLCPCLEGVDRGVQKSGSVSLRVNGVQWSLVLGLELTYYLERLATSLAGCPLWKLRELSVLTSVYTHVYIGSANCKQLAYHCHHCKE